MDKTRGYLNKNNKLNKLVMYFGMPHLKTKQQKHLEGDCRVNSNWT